MSQVPYSSIVRSIMYVMICIRIYIAHVMEVVNRFMTNPDGESIGVILRGSLNTLKEPQVLHYVLKY